ncbi:MAG TPA: hypothetical protein VM099_08700 [Gemmatimonadaceae bacterium]|nr:hypothetical protein [Gemmatimonadaceae bacterium]
MAIDKRENEILNLYRASELHGGLILGQIVRRTSDIRLIVSLTRHSAEQLLNARVWTETIIRANGTLVPVETLYDRRVSLGGAPVTIIDTLAVVQVVEKETCDHLLAQLAAGNVHPIFDDTMKRMIDVERRHIDWVKAWLYDESRQHQKEVRRALRRYAVQSSETVPVFRTPPGETIELHPSS